MDAEAHTPAQSPLSGSRPGKIRDLPRSYLLEQLEKYYGKKPPAEAVECDYSLWKCAETGLEFAWPMRPGNLCFYEWVSAFASYYPGDRWEYGQVHRLIEAAHLAGGKPAQVLDAGCGAGDFLRSLDFLPNGAKHALDLNEPAVEACRRHGFHAFCGTMETALADGFVKRATFPVVTSFHCLEHVEQPVDFVRSLAEVTAPGGRIYLSTPYSPMSFESEWFDILNHPPHHMTRWNLAAYQRLAGLLNLKLRSFFPPSSAARRALSIFRLLQYGPNVRAGKARLVKDMLLRAPKLSRLYQAQRERPRRNGGVSADVILVELTVP